MLVGKEESSEIRWKSLLRFLYYNYNCTISQTSLLTISFYLVSYYYHSEFSIFYLTFKVLTGWSKDAAIRAMMVEMEGHETVEKRRINLAPALPKRGQSPSRRRRRRRRTVSGRDVARREDEKRRGRSGIDGHPHLHAWLFATTRSSRP